MEITTVRDGVRVYDLGIWSVGVNPVGEQFNIKFRFQETDGRNVFDHA